MRLEYYNELGQPVVVAARRVVIYDAHGQPISLALEQATALVHVSHVQDRDFPTLLRELGLSTTHLSRDTP